MSELQAERAASAEGPPRRRDPLAFVRGQVRETHVQLLASQVLNGVVALAANILMARALTPTGRGEVALLLQVVYLATQVLLLGTERSFMAEYHGVAPAAGLRAYARLLVVPGVVAVVGAAGYAAVAPDRFNPGPGTVALIVCYAMTEAVILGTRAVATSTKTIESPSPAVSATARAIRRAHRKTDSKPDRQSSSVTSERLPERGDAPLMSA